jgi:hypothetical protein
MSRSADTLRDCPACAAPPTQSITPDAIERLKPSDLARLASEVARIGEGGVRHAVAIDDLVGVYEVLEADCSYFDHKHRKGLVIRSRCGLLLQIGLTCGRKNVVGFDQIKFHLKIAYGVEEERSVGDAVFQELLERVEVLGAKIDKRRECLVALQRHLPDFYQEMSAAKRTVLLHERRYDPIADRETFEDVAYYLEGLGFFRGMPTSALNSLTERATHHARTRKAAAIDFRNYREIRAERSAIRKRVGELEDFVRDVDRFWVPSNLDLALRKTYGDRRPVNVTLEGSAIVVSGNVTYVISVDGIVER